MATGLRKTRELVLVLDDEREMCAFLADLLTEEWYVVETYQKGEAALAALEKDGADLLITDLEMKGCVGWRCCVRPSNVIRIWRL
jgi:DNA-binding response OmpR family regulator